MVLSGRKKGSKNQTVCLRFSFSGLSPDSISLFKEAGQLRRKPSIVSVVYSKFNDGHMFIIKTALKYFLLISKEVDSVPAV